MTFDVVTQVYVFIDDVSSEIVVGQTESVLELLFSEVCACYATQASFI